MFAVYGNLAILGKARVNPWGTPDGCHAFTINFSMTYTKFTRQAPAAYRLKSPYREVYQMVSRVKKLPIKSLIDS